MTCGTCPRGCAVGECCCGEPSCRDTAYTGLCDECGGYDECYCEEE